MKSNHSKKIAHSPKEPHHRIICADVLLPQLRHTMENRGQATTKRRLCPKCQKRTTLYHLGDDRRKCKVCGKKFTLKGQKNERRFRQIADILLCFSLDLPALQAAKITQYRQPTVDILYRSIRQGITEGTWGKRRIRLSCQTEKGNREFTNSAFCQRCHKRPGCHGRIKDDAPVFGVLVEHNGNIRLDPLADEPFLQHGLYCPPIVRRKPSDPYIHYGGFICHGTFHRFTDRQESGHMRDGLEQFWSWAEERLHRHHGIRTENLGSYLKELEWKYNHRTLDPVEQAQALIPLLPPQLLLPRKPQK